MQTLDLRKQYQSLYSPSAKQVQVVEVPRLTFLMIDGTVEPGHGPGDSPMFEENNEAIYGAAYTLKFMFKKRAQDPIDYPVMALEGRWWVESGQFRIDVKDNWGYTLMIMQPDLVTPETFAEALAQLRKKRGDLPALARLRLESFAEGTSVQTLHLGPYATEMETIARMDEFATQNGWRMHGQHHEIYMGDPRKTAPEKLKTILRHPVTR